MKRGHTSGRPGRPAAGVLPRLLLSCVSIVVLLVFAASPSSLVHAQDEKRVSGGEVYEKELDRFEKLSEAIWEQVEPIVTGSKDADYSIELLDDIKTLYDMEYEDERITYHSRNWVTGIYRDMFPIHAVNRQGELITNADRTLMRLDEEAADVFSEHVTDMIEHAFDELNLIQRKRLYYFAAHTLGPEDEDALRLLDAYLLDPTLAPDERDEIFDARVRIRMSPQRDER